MAFPNRILCLASACFLFPIPQSAECIIAQHTATCKTQGLHYPILTPSVIGQFSRKSPAWSHSGSQGLKDLQGPQGSQGLQGLQGLQGPQGAHVLGPPGSIRIMLMYGVVIHHLLAIPRDHPHSFHAVLFTKIASFGAVHVYFPVFNDRLLPPDQYCEVIWESTWSLSLLTNPCRTKDIGNVRY